MENSKLLNLHILNQIYSHLHAVKMTESDLISKSGIGSRYIRGEKPLTVYALYKISLVLDLDMEYFFEDFKN